MALCGEKVSLGGVSLGRSVHQNGLHEIHAQNHANEATIIGDGQDSEPAAEHIVEGVADFFIGASGVGVFGCEGEDGFFGELAELAALDDGAGDITFGDHGDDGEFGGGDDEGGKLIDVHLVHGIPNGAGFEQSWDVGVEDFSQNHGAEVTACLPVGRDAGGVSASAEGGKDAEVTGLPSIAGFCHLSGNDAAFGASPFGAVVGDDYDAGFVTTEEGDLVEGEFAFDFCALHDIHDSGFELRALGSGDDFGVQVREGDDSEGEAKHPAPTLEIVVLLDRSEEGDDACE